MNRDKGYTEQVLEEQIQKYKEALLFNEKDLEGWLEFKFGTEDNCPVCIHRAYLDSACREDDFFESCLAIDENNDSCSFQAWYRELTGIPEDARARQILKQRLKYWREVYAEKYPVKP